MPWQITLILMIALILHVQWKWKCVNVKVCVAHTAIYRRLLVGNYLLYNTPTLNSFKIVFIKMKEYYVSLFCGNDK